MVFGLRVAGSNRQPASRRMISAPMMITVTVRVRAARTTSAPAGQRA
jgi:hypothetical protein